MTTKSSAPRLRVRILSSSESLPEQTMTGTALWRRILASTSMPSKPGSPRSRMTSAGRVLEDGPERGGPVDGLGHPVAGALEVLEQCAAAAVIVLGHEDRPLSLLGPSGRTQGVRADRAELPQTVGGVSGCVSPRRRGRFMRRPSSHETLTSVPAEGVCDPCCDCRLRQSSTLRNHASPRRSGDRTGRAARRRADDRRHHRLKDACIRRRRQWLRRRKTLHRQGKEQRSVQSISGGCHTRQKPQFRGAGDVKRDLRGLCNQSTTFTQPSCKRAIY